ncbi:hypothetical protein BJ322DRAFT_1101760 [Thelephora terrestris]|uniref:Uncharacterized protein n=1 Tax=Thelephora terrestris TaxID=56493 RepID=A0A9P6L2D0_9AGAM|nr:hypothetical protein BJ322DRAFT_1101760 [Thelephora terrestris]
MLATTCRVAPAPHLPLQLAHRSPCDRHGHFLPPGTPPLPPPPKSNDDWTPFALRAGFELADILYLKAHLSQRTINELLEIWSATLVPHSDLPPILDHRDLHAQIDAIKLGNIPWRSYTAQYQWLRPNNGPVPEWMQDKYQLWYRDPRQVVRHILANPEFTSGIDYAPHRDFQDEERQYHDFMSGDWAWEQCDIIAMDPTTHGSMFVPIILGTDKTTVSVATGQHTYHPVYLSVGNVHNRLRRAHKAALVLIGFLPIPKGTREDTKCKLFRDFRRRLYHGSLTVMNDTLKPYMTTWDIVQCADYHFRRAIYGIGPHISDYPEQSVAAGIVYGCCDADPADLDGSPAELRTLKQLLSLFNVTHEDTLWFGYGIVPDFLPFTTEFPHLLHQAIKGTFKDHLVTWVEEYLTLQHGSSRGSEILDEVDRRVALVPLFPGLHRFKQGRNFQQWTGNDSKAFMKVFVTSLEGFVPIDIIKTLISFLDLCYIARLDTISESSLDALDNALEKFHHYRKIFHETGVRPTGFSLPRQHALTHYRHHIEKFGALNGLSSSITESKHITAVKKPWRQSSHYEALGQMLTINTRNDKLNAARVDFSTRSMLDGTCLGEALKGLRDPLEDVTGGGDNAEGDLNDNDDHGRDLDAEEDDEETGPVDGPPTLSNVSLALKRARGYPLNSFWELGQHIKQENLEALVRNPAFTGTPSLSACPTVESVQEISVFHSAKATFRAPSNASGIEGLYRETIRSTPRWQTSGVTAPRRDPVLLATGSDTAGVRGLDVARFKDKSFECTLVHEYCKAFTDPDPDNGLWIFEPDYSNDGYRIMSVVHLDSVIRAAHLLPAFKDDTPMPREINFTHTLNVFKAFYLNKYIDYHAFETLT